MALFLVSYDQHRDRDYTPIWSALRDWGAKRVLESVWLVSIASDAGALRDTLRSVTRSEDSLAIVEIKPGSMWASFNGQHDGVAWLRQHVTA